jgi:hypothetical protein
MKRVKLNLQDEEQTSQAEEEEEASSYVPFDDIVKEQPKMPGTKCWGCIYNFSKPMIPGKDPVMDRLWNIYENNPGTLFKRAELIAREYEKSIYIPGLKLQKKVLSWPIEMVLY